MDILYYEPELIIALNRKVIFVNPNDLQIFKEIELAEDLATCGLNPAATSADTECANGEAEKQQSKQKPPKLEVPTVQHVEISPDRQLCAVTTAGQKAVLLYKCRPAHAKLVSARPLARASSALAFKDDSKTLLVTDKSGDCYEYDCVDLEAPPRLLLGHLSIVYDILWAANFKYVITCDRDDKIRVTNYPDTHDIHGYCLGHKEFVSGLAALNESVIVSVSGDKTMRLWNFKSGEELAKYELPAPALRLTVRPLDDGKYQAAVLLYQPNECVALLELTKTATGDWNIIEQEVLKFPEVICCNFCFVGQRLFVTGIVDDHFSLKVAALADDVPRVPDKWLEMVEQQFEHDIWKAEDISTWFKKRYDNVSEYLERKRRRIEEKQK